MDPHPDHYRYLAKERMADQQRQAARRAPRKRIAARPPLKHSLARSLLWAAFALDSSAVWSGLWEKLSPAEPRANQNHRTG